MVSRFYKRNIAEGRPILYFSIAFAILVRIIYFLFADVNEANNEKFSNYLWDSMQPLFSSNLVSWCTSFALLLCMAGLAAFINKKFVLIRVRTALVGSIILLAFSSHPVFFPMSVEYLSTLTILVAIGLTFDIYEKTWKQIYALYIGGVLAFGSLFQPSLLFYLPLFWTGLIIMNSLSFKSFLASLIGLVIIYFPVFSYYLSIGQLDLFIESFTEITNVDWLQLPILEMNINDTVTYLLFTISLIIIIFEGYNTRYNDKIKIRAYIFFLVFTTISVFIAASFVNFSVFMNMCIGVCTMSILAAHFFVLTNIKWVSWYYYALLILTIVFSFSHLFYFR